MAHRELLDVTEAGEMPFSVEVFKFFHCICLKNLCVRALQRFHHLIECFRKLTRRIGGSILPLGLKVINLHCVILFMVNKCEMNYDSVGRPSCFAIFVANCQKVSKPIHSFVLKGCVQVRKWFDGVVVSTTFSLESVSQKNSVGILEVLLVKLATVILEENVRLIFRRCA